jgi:hypothetical protein
MHLFLLAFTAGPGVTESTSAGSVDPVTAAFNKAWRYVSTHMNEQTLPGNPYPSTEFPWVEVAVKTGDLLDIIYKNYLYNYNNNLPPFSNQTSICVENFGCLYVNPTFANSINSGITVVLAPPPTFVVPPIPFVANPPPYLQYVDPNGATGGAPCFLLMAAWDCP